MKMHYFHLFMEFFLYFIDTRPRYGYNHDGGDLVNSQNICRFVPTYSTEKELTAIHFVYEANPESNPKFIIPAANAMYLVSAGRGILHTLHGSHKLQAGDLFFTFQAKSYSIENTEGLEYFYITFIGRRAEPLFNRAGISFHQPICHGFEPCISHWDTALQNSTQENIDLISESVLLHTFAEICNTYQEPSASRKSEEAIWKIKQYVDQHYFEADLSLKRLGLLYLYSPKYISSQFRTALKVGFKEYLQQLRLAHAVELMKNGLKNISEIALLSGYADPLYFSKVFKRKFSVSPKAYLSMLSGR